MDISDMDFFHKATMRICGSLDIDTVLSRCLSFFKPHLPISAIAMCILEEKTGLSRCIASKIESGQAIPDLPKTLQMDPKAMDDIRKHINEPVAIINEPQTHPVGKLVSATMGDPKVSSLTLKLIVENKLIGTVSLFADGCHRYDGNHARLLNLLHDPFAIALSNTLKHQEVIRLKDLLVDDNRYLNRELHARTGDEVIGQNNGLKEVMEIVGQVAPLSNQVLILGETGVGKELIANSIHYSSTRAKGPFIKVNCGAIPDALIDSELFGHEKGAFTGAITRKRGRFERADKGTIFLDEIGELPLPAQIRLLRVIQNKEIERVGGSRLIPLDIRIIAATHRNLEAMVKKGRFREDLWFRLNVFPITIPPLRHRAMDIPALVHHFIEKKSREMNLEPPPPPSPATMQRLQAYHWPGNVRELENVVERALIRRAAFPSNNWLRVDEPPICAVQETGAVEPSPQPAILNLDDITRRHIEYVLGLTRGRVHGEKGAARLMGVNSSTLRFRMNKLGVAYGKKARNGQMTG